MVSPAILAVIAVVLFLCMLYKNGVRSKRYEDLINKLPQNSNNVIGNLGILIAGIIRTGDPGRSLYLLQRKFHHEFAKDGLFLIRLRPILPDLVVLLSPRSYHDLLVDKNNIHKNLTYEILKDLMGDRNLIHSGGREWKHDRKIIDPSFKYSNLISKNQLIIKRANIFMSMIDNSENNTIKNVHRTLAQLIAHLILEAAVGIELDVNHPDLVDYVNTIRMFETTIVTRYAFPLLLNYYVNYYLTPSGIVMRKNLDKAKKFVTKMVNQRIDFVKSQFQDEQDDETNSNYQDKKIRLNSCFADTLITSFLSDSKSLVDKQMIMNQVNTFVFVGHKATSITLNAILLLIAKHDNVQKKLQDEIDSIFDLDNIDEELINNDKLNECKYLTLVIKEGERMFPISATIGREITSEISINDYTLPVGCHVTFDFNSLTKHFESFPDKPNDFIPERHEPGNELFDETRSPFAMLPFSHGLRKCIGEKFATHILKIFIIKLLIKYDLSSKINLDDLNIVQDIMVYFKNPTDITFTQRVIGNQRNLA